MECKKGILILLLLFIVFSLTGCGPKNFSGEISVKKTGSISGQIADKSSGKLLDLVDIEIAGKYDTTNSKGSFYIEDLETGEHMLMAAKSGYQSKSINIVIMEGSNSLGNKIKLVAEETDNKVGTLNGRDYFIIEEGYGIRYSVIGDDYSDYWAVFQYNDGDYFTWTFSPTFHDTELSFVENDYTFTRGYKNHDGFIMFDGSGPNSSPGNLLDLFCIPVNFELGDSWIGSDGIKYIAESAETVTISNREFNDVIKVNIESLKDNIWDHVRGTGYYLLAKNVGIIKMVFNNVDGSEYIFEYKESEYFNGNMISGRVVNNNQALNDVIVGLSNFRMDHSYTKTDGKGNFNLLLYGPTGNLFIGYDENNDYRLDRENTSTKNMSYKLNNVINDINDLVIDVQNFWK